MPKISIIIPNYNGERFVAEAIESVQAQKESDWEIVFVDDGSTDRSVEIARGLAEEDDRIRVLQNTRKKGVSGARNTGLQRVSGEWIAFLDSDDMLASNGLSSRMDAAVRHPECKCIGCDFAKINEDGSERDDPFFLSKPNVVAALKDPEYCASPYIIANTVEFFASVAVILIPSSSMIHRSVLDTIGLFDETMTHDEDVDFLYRAVAHECLLFVPEVLVYYRQHGESASSQQRKRIDSSVNLHRKLYHDPGFERYKTIMRARLIRSLMEGAYYHRSHENYNVARSYALQAILHAPFNLIAWRNLLAGVLHRR